ncbi:hypothetical protein HC028_22675 [Planosporangium flavigriseum]|uniref:Chemotaxis methyl-accepting receptor HlyB-like 4HB MCP domain-containing protein n=1 Tax=Planosporangium flavigriseum TaxID=373681 RepID=A0A8J3LXN4_9ACTN|nr:MCP four helix bundle domain-containing protein [Planosporangium flavigriseum]NJC67284.1 hypothetical protein [Planosporangium flavigriseum]GIG75250.1 hypothetical protein Pfl04_36540 [Planosporangium flavigriseum]
MHPWFWPATLAKAHRRSLGLIVGLMLLPTALSSWQLWSAATKIDHIARVSASGTRIIGQIDGLTKQYRADQWTYLVLGPGHPQRQETVDSMARIDADLRELFASYRELPLRTENRESLAKYEQDWNEYLRATSATFDLTHGRPMWDTLKADRGAEPARMGP